MLRLLLVLAAAVPLLLPCQALCAGGKPSLDRMIGSMIMCGFRGAELAKDDPVRLLLQEGRLGHVILFDRDMATKGSRNVVSKAQLKRLTDELRAVAARPLFIAVDQEGGRVARLLPRHGFASLPSAKAMGQGTPEATRRLALGMGRELKEAGINLDFAPVVDVDATKGPRVSLIASQERCFGRDPELAARHALAFGEGLAQAGVVPCLKHFPGLGCASADSHLGRTDVTACFDKARDLAPYRKAAASGWPGMVMVSHAVCGAIEPDRPASLSKPAVDGILRGQLGWQGVVVSDDLQMRAVADHYSLEEAVRLAVDAGVDILLFGNNLHWDPGMAERAFTTLRRLVDAGVVPQARIEASWLRIQRLLNRLEKAGPAGL